MSEVLPLQRSLLPRPRLPFLPRSLSQGHRRRHGHVQCNYGADLGDEHVANGGNGTISLATPMNIGTLTFNGAATLQPVTSSAAAGTAAFNVTTALNLSGEPTALPLPPLTPAVVGAPDHTIWFNMPGPGGTGFAAFNPTVAITGLGVHQNATLTNPAGFINLAIGGYSTVWKGNLNQNWDTTTQNWVKSTDSSGVLYTNGDATNFDDTATTTSILISGAER